MKSTDITPQRYTIAFAFLAIGVFLSWKSITSRIVGEVSFVSFIILTVIVFLLILLSNQIAYLKSKYFEIKFKEIKESEILVKELALMVATIAEQLHSNALLISDFDENKFKDTIKKIKEIASK